MIIAKDKLKKVLITRTARAHLVSEDLVELIVDFQGKDASEAVKKFGEVEFSGFGKLKVSQSKVRKRIKNLERGIGVVSSKMEVELSDLRKVALTAKLNGMTEQLKYYKSKLDNE